MAHDVRAPLRSLMVNGHHCWATLWRIERVDGAVFRFTEHDQVITLDGEDYLPAGSTVTASAREHSEGTSPQNLEIRGAVVDDSITEADLQAGKYRRARVTEILVDWRFPWAGSFVQNVYFVEETMFSADSWTAKLLGLVIQLRPQKGDTLERSCRYRLGDPDTCGVDLAPFTQVDRVVTGIVTPGRKFSTTATGADNLYANGRFIWTTTGDNVGFEAQVKTHVGAGGVIELQLQAQYPVQVGDEFTVVAGCDYLITTCKDKFDNVLRNGGFPHIPGNDRLFQTVLPPTS